MAEDAQMKIRLPKALKERIEAAAIAENRSLNGEIVSRLEASFPDLPSIETASPRRGMTFMKMVRRDQIAEMADDIARIKLTLEKMGVELEPLPDWPRSLQP